MMSLEDDCCSCVEEQRICEIMSALRMEDSIDVECILQNPLVTNTLVSGQMSLIHLACHMGSLRLVKALLEKGENVDCKTGDGSHPIHILCSNVKYGNSLNILELLFQYDVDLDAQDSSGRTALFLACSNSLVAVVEVLIRAGCNVNIPNQEHYTAFSVSCRLASEGWYFWNADCYDDDNGVLEPSNFPASLICRALLKAGANPTQGTLLPSAILYGTKDIIKEFLDLRMDVNALDENRRTPLGCACSAPHIPTSIVRLLLDAGANVNGHSGGGKSKPIILAFVHNSVEKIRLLLSYGAIINTEEMAELVSVSLSKWFLENPDVIHEDSKELLAWKLLSKAGFSPQLDMYILKLKRVYLCSSYSKVSKTIDNLLFPLMSLSDICRISIRSQISPPGDDKIDKLPVPNRLKAFLKFDEFVTN